jgi:hypothetical protein
MHKSSDLVPTMGLVPKYNRLFSKFLELNEHKPVKLY